MKGLMSVLNDNIFQMPQFKILKKKKKKPWDCSFSLRKICMILPAKLT